MKLHVKAVLDTGAPSSPPIRECQTNVILAQLLSINVNSLRTNVTVREQALSAIFPRIVSLVFLYSF